tara:strand:+ start:24278 stop:25138 length:861 start_codon:yes stop_codon:yes gene_type:complete
LKSDQYNLRHHVEILAAAKPARTFKNPEALETAADYISGKIEEYGLVSKKMGFVVNDKTYYNVVTHLGPSDGEAIVIGAHYDAFDELPGADDNASGVAGLLELARMLAPMNDKLKRPVILVAYSLEEPPNFRTENMGSFVHAQMMKNQGRSIKLMISLEMIGYFKDESGSQDYPIPGLSFLYSSTGNFISIVGRYEEWSIIRDIKSRFMSATDLPVYSANISKNIPGVDYSDHANYWDQGFPAVMITDTAFMRNPNYHEKTDTPETLNYRLMSEVVNGVYAVIVGL